MLDHQQDRMSALADPEPESSSSAATPKAPEPERIIEKPRETEKKLINNVDLLPEEPPITYTFDTTASLPVFNHRLPKKKNMKAQIDKELEEAAKKEK